MKFALNLSLPFKTPEMFFEGKKDNVGKVAGFDPKSLKDTGDLFKEKGGKCEVSTQEMVVFCGSPGSGKSTFVTTHFKNYSRVNRYNIIFFFI